MKHRQKMILSIGLALGSVGIVSVVQTHRLPGQLSPQINVFSAVESGNGITIRADQHNIVTCSENTSSPIAIAPLQSSIMRFWVYEYSSLEPQVTGKFYISPGEMAIHPEYTAIDTLRGFSGGKRYYIMSETDLLFRCGKGLSKSAMCGDGILDRGEVCDTESDGCNQSTCTAQDGYICTENACTIFIPNLGTGEAEAATNEVNVSTVQEPATTAVALSSVHASPREEMQHSTQPQQPQRNLTTIEVSNANMDPDGSAVPTGVYPLGVFRFSAVSTNTSPASLENILFTIETANVVIGAQEFQFYNLRKPDEKIACTSLYSSGDPFLSQQISGKFIVRCAHLSTGGISTMILANEHADFVLEGNVLQSQLSSTGNSNIRISLERLGQQNGMFGIFGSRTEWLEPSGESRTIRILPALEPVFSTQYSL